MQNFHDTGTCPIRSILCRLSTKWALLVLVTLNANEVMRYKEIKRSIGDISERMLSLSLQNLCADGLISRTVFGEVPPRVDYALTDLGKSLMPYVLELVNWAEEHATMVFEHRENYEAPIKKPHFSY